jgi:hypothetical protein
MKITLRGMANADLQMRRIADGARAMGQNRVEVGTRLPYGYGQEYGHHRKNGRLARRAGPALYLNRAVAAVRSDGRRDIAEGLNRVTRPGVWVLKRLGRWARRLARIEAPRKSGRLRRGVKVYLNGRRA